jgi:aspartate aminotransferase
MRSFTGLIPNSTYPVDEPFSLNAEYFDDNNPSKVNLGIGVYRTEEGHPWPLSVVEEAEKSLYSRQDVSRHEYLTIQGDLKFLDLARDLAFDLVSKSKAEDHQSRKRIVSVQTVSGTGANHIGANYLSKVLRPRRVWLPDLTWSNHAAIWQVVGVEACVYPYYDENVRGINFKGMMRVLGNETQPGDVVLFHACAHNPTGSDPSREQWKSLIELCRCQGLVPFLDLAYQGFASGDVSEDAWAIKTFLNQPDLEFCVAQSFSKNFGLYGQRAGALHVVVSSKSVEFRDSVLSNLCHFVRGEYSMAPRTGSDIVRTVLENSHLRNQWQQDLLHMSGRIKNMRRGLFDELIKLGTPGSWTHIIQQVSHSDSCMFKWYSSLHFDRLACSLIPV